MGRVNDTISNVNSAMRNLLLTVLIGGAGFGGYKAYELYNEPQQKLADKEAELEKSSENLKRANEDLAARQKLVEDLNVQLKDKSAELDRVQVAMNLLKVRHRLARLKVLDQHEVPSLNPAPPTAGTERAGTPPT